MMPYTKVGLEHNNLAIAATRFVPTSKQEPGSSTAAALDKSNGNVRAVQHLSRHANLTRTKRNTPIDRVPLLN
jgi:site-specific recombinase XerC